MPDRPLGAVEAVVDHADQQADDCGSHAGRGVRRHCAPQDGEGTVKVRTEVTSEVKCGKIASSESNRHRAEAHGEEKGREGGESDAQATEGCVALRVALLEDKDAAHVHGHARQKVIGLSKNSIRGAGLALKPI